MEVAQLQERHPKLPTVARCPLVEAVTRNAGKKVMLLADMPLRLQLKGTVPSHRWP